MEKIFNYHCNVGEELSKKYNFSKQTEIPESSDAELVVWNNNKQFDIKSLAHFPKIKTLLNWGSDITNLSDIEEIKKKGVEIKTVKGYSTNAVSEYILTSLMKMFGEILPKREELSGKKIGIIGMGDIGSKVSEILQSLNCEIKYFSRTQKDNNLPFLNLEDLIAQSDAVVIAVNSKEFTIPIDLLIKLTDEGKLKDDFIISNVSRDFVLPVAEVMDGVRKGILPQIKMTSDVSPSSKMTELYPENYTPHIAYKSVQSAIAKDQVLQDCITNLNHNGKNT